MTRIVHLSDWHGTPLGLVDGKLPEGDVYVVTGDMLPNFPLRSRDRGAWADPRAPGSEYRIVREREERKQIEWVRENAERFSALLPSANVPVLCLQGNHDFVSYAGLFAARGNRIVEFGNPATCDVIRDLTFAGHVGIPAIFGTWNHEVSRADLMDRVRMTPPCDVLLTHYPPVGVLDLGYGLEGMQAALQYKVKRLHCFGHIHELGGEQETIGDVVFSNAACAVNVVDL